MACVEFKNITMIFENKVKAADNINISIEAGEFTVLVGPSGCGKSTALRMIAGLEEPTEGEIFIEGKSIIGVSPKDRDIAMVFQNYALYPHMTIYDNIAFGLKVRKIEKSEIEKRVNETAEILGLKELLQRKPKQLSGGQMQRVALGRAMVRKPKVFLFDEPLSNLDAKLRIQMRAEISKLHKRIGATMVYVTHDQTEAMTMGDRIVVMKDGVVQQVDTPLNLYNNPVNMFVAGFIGSPSMNFIKGRIELAAGVKFSSDDKKLEIDLPEKYTSNLENYFNKDLILGLRPEDIAYNLSAEKNIDANVELVEQMGNETFVYFLINGEQMIARLPSSALFKPEENISLSINKEKILFFDALDFLRII